MATSITVKLFNNNNFPATMITTANGIEFTIVIKQNTLRDIAEFLGLDEIYVKHYLLYGDTAKSVKLSNAKLQKNDLNNIIKNFEGETLQNAIYNTNNITLTGDKKRTYKLSLKGSKQLILSITK